MTMPLPKQKTRIYRCVILAAGAPHQGQSPALLESVNGMTVIDWLLNALSLAETDIDLVLGYQSADITNRYAGIRTLENPSWKTTGSASSLLLTDLEGLDELLVCYGDILFREQLVDALTQLNSPIAIAWDSHWKQRYVDRDPQDLEVSEKVLAKDDSIQRLGSDIPADWATGEFIGLVRFSGEALVQLRKLQKHQPESIKKLHLAGLVELLRCAGLPVAGCDVAGDWAEVNQPKDIAHFVLGTKADTLSRLRSMLSSAIIQDQLCITTAEWFKSRTEVLEKVRNKFSGVAVVVRSSARSEDAFTHSNAGAYTSVLNVDVSAGLDEAIEQVINSYDDMQLDDQVLIQPMLKNVVMSGVVFTRTLERGAPWYVINYDESGSTDGITSGANKDQRVLYVRRDAAIEQIADSRLSPLVIAIQEIERLLAYDALDVEFAVDVNNQVHILQVRPIAVEKSNGQQLTNQIYELLSQAEERWNGLQQPAPHIVGDNPIYGVMPDWNPAEIIGTNPGRLAETLYRYLLMDEVWATQRAEFGYRDVRPLPLLISFAGKPYIDVRASFNSFIPANVPDALAARLVTFYLDFLRRKPYLHDKVEFDVVPTCMALNFEKWRLRLAQEANLNVAELNILQDGLTKITSNAIERTNTDLARVAELEFRYSAIGNLEFDHPVALLERVRLLLDDCRLYGTLPFAHLARSAFIAVTILKEAVAIGLVSESAKDQFMASVRTVSHELSEDARATALGSMSWQNFEDKYGHLRPGTYDLMSPSYREDPDKFLKPLLSSGPETKIIAADASLWHVEKLVLFDAIRSKGLNYTNEELELFLRNAIVGREKAKFIFTRNLSMALDLLTHWGELQGLGREDLSNLPITELLYSPDLAAPYTEQIANFKVISAKAREYREISLACELPALICDRNDFYSFLLQPGQPNYIGTVRVVANRVNIDAGAVDALDSVSGCIVMITQADPGYDWLFGKGIAGLVTMYGGANSHMAIRAAEFGLSAAIGIGEQLYRQLSYTRVIELDPVNNRLIAIQL